MPSLQSNTRNVKLGVCNIFYDGQDLGLTKGGVEVTVTTDTHKVVVDQFGNSAINENILGREVMVKAPLAETTIENMVRIMPGSSLKYVGGAAATGTVTIGTNPTTAQTVLINGVTVTFKTTGVVPSNDEVLIGANAAATATNLAAMLNASTNPALAVCQYVAAASVVTATYGAKSLEGNAVTLAAGTSAATVSGATLSGGTDPTSARVDVTTGVGIDLLALAKELRLHPKGKALSDKSDDFVIPLAATAGALTFAYKLDEERIFDVEFSGYPDTVTDRVFYVGDEAAV